MLRWKDKTTATSLGAVLYAENDNLGYAMVYGPVETSKPWVRISRHDEIRSTWHDSVHTGFNSIDEAKVFVESELGSSEPQKVWVVLWQDGFNGQYFTSVFDSQEKAERYRKNVGLDHRNSVIQRNDVL